MTAVAQPQNESLKLRDGTLMDLTRVPGVDDATWIEVKAYLEENPDVAKSLQKFAKDPVTMRAWLQTRALAEHYYTKMNSGDPQMQQRLQAADNDPELAPIFADIRKNGMEVMMKYYQNEELMHKISQKMGGLPGELQQDMKTLSETPFSIHEGAKHGNLQGVKNLLAKGESVDSRDEKCITPLGYAVGFNHVQVVKLLLERGANQSAVDFSGNSGLHYAAGYGHREIVECLVMAGGNVNQANKQGQTPMAVASVNKQSAIMNLLASRGAFR